MTAPRQPTEPLAAEFGCLWCGRVYRPRNAGDLEAWARLCPDCIARAQENPFLRGRLRAGIAARAAATAGRTPSGSPAVAEGGPAVEEARESEREARRAAPAPAADPSLDAEMIRYYAARAGEYDDWYLRRGRYSHGPLHDVAWQADLDAATLWLDALPFGGDIVELAAGTGWWSPLLAAKGTLWLYDAAPEPLERARNRLIAHGLRAHLHVRDAWAEPDRAVDAVFAGFWLSHVERGRLGEFLGLVRRWLKPGGLFAFVDSRRDPQSGAADHEGATGDVAVRRLADGSTFRVRKVFYEPAELRAALEAAGFEAATVERTARFFLLGSARRSG